MGTASPTITAAIRDLNATHSVAVMRRSSGRIHRRSLAVAGIAVTILLCQLLGSGHCFSIGGGGDPLDQPFIVQATIDDRDASNVLINEVENVQKTCER